MMHGLKSLTRPEYDVIIYVGYSFFDKPSQCFNQLLKGIVPGVHLDDPYSRDDLVHDTHTLISQLCCLQPGVKEVLIKLKYLTLILEQSTLVA